jgi:hypothetical protein
MIGGEQPIGSDLPGRAVRERRTGPGDGLARLRQRVKAGVERETAERDQDRIRRHPRELALQVLAAIGELLRERPIRGGSAAARRRDERPGEVEPVAPVPRFRLVRQPDAVERAEEEIPGFVSGEHPAGAVAAVSRRSEADDQDSSVGVPEGGYRPRPVLLSGEAAGRMARRFLPPGHQPRASAAEDDLPLDRGQRLQGPRATFWSSGRSGGPRRARGRAWPSPGPRG